MNEDENFQKKMDTVWERFLASLAIEKQRKLEKLEQLAHKEREQFNR